MSGMEEKFGENCGETVGKSGVKGWEISWVKTVGKSWMKTSILRKFIDVLLLTVFSYWWTRPQVRKECILLMNCYY
ncbi:hypothetical protein [Methanosarcina sp. 1.H.A.2.2]|uniref:hypothetical protein n=1 Tax=Methanosarcina sp. 1.H.A.2.2 TaxID=1483601 RepID=UPI000621ECD0|nr:hypothetical protein [Methanosarcina sp. 1.H.A.2.2]KKH46603.1 hypothetical protein EO93_10490 [Methanosarcina sp. 1.H.A.2.2]